MRGKRHGIPGLRGLRGVSLWFEKFDDTGCIQENVQYEARRENNDNPRTPRTSLPCVRCSLARQRTKSRKTAVPTQLQRRYTIPSARRAKTIHGLDDHRRRERASEQSWSATTPPNHLPGSVPTGNQPAGIDYNVCVCSKGSVCKTRRKNWTMCTQNRPRKRCLSSSSLLAGDGAFNVGFVLRIDVSHPTLKDDMIAHTCSMCRGRCVKTPL